MEILPFIVMLFYLMAYIATGSGAYALFITSGVIVLFVILLAIAAEMDSRWAKQADIDEKIRCFTTVDNTLNTCVEYLAKNGVTTPEQDNCMVGFYRRFSETLLQKLKERSDCYQTIYINEVIEPVLRLIQSFIYKMELQKKTAEIGEKSSQIGIHVKKSKKRKTIADHDRQTLAQQANYCLRELTRYQEHLKANTSALVIIEIFLCCCEFSLRELSAVDRPEIRSATKKILELMQPFLQEQLKLESDAYLAIVAQDLRFNPTPSPSVA